MKKKLVLLLLVSLLLAPCAIAEQPELHTLWNMQFGVTTTKQFIEIAKSKTHVEFVTEITSEYLLWEKATTKDGELIDFFGNKATLTARFEGEDEDGRKKRLEKKDWASTNKLLGKDADADMPDRLKNYTQNGVLTGITILPEVGDQSRIILVAENTYKGLLDRFGIPDDQIVVGVVDSKEIYKEVPTIDGAADFSEIVKATSEFEEPLGFSTIWNNAKLDVGLTEQNPIFWFSLSDAPENFDDFDIEGRTRDVSDGLK